ncbi:MAG: TIGR01244 family phosphatase [Sphingomonas sp.]|nr:TIGR01244 family phosphatase [Sphingomonas sp.]
MFRVLDDSTFVSGQIGSEDVAQAAALGVTMIVNNRPDGEEPGQPAGGEIAAAAEAAGLAYRHIPVAGGFAPEQVETMAEALEAAEGKVLAFCKSGTRSTFLWALAEKRRGGDGAAIMEQAAAAGYDLSPLRPYLLG